jgi:hypothetical protein
VREKRGKPKVSRAVKESIGSSFAHARNVGDGDGKEIERVADGCAVKVSVRFNSIVSRDNGIVNRRAQFMAGNPRCVVNRVPRCTVNLRGAPQ